METPGIGAKFAFGDVGAVFTALTTGWTLVGELTDLDPPEPEADDIETTHHDITDKHKTFQAGLVDGGEAEITAHYDKTQLAALVALQGVDKVFRIVFSDGSGVGWAGYLKSYKPEADIEGLTTMKFKFKVSGKPTLITALA